MTHAALLDYSPDPQSPSANTYISQFNESGLSEGDRLRNRNRLALAELDVLERTATIAGWNGRGSRAIPQSLFTNAKRVIGLLPTYLPKPGVFGTSTGGLVFCWEDDDEAQFSVVLSGDKIGVAANIDTVPDHTEGDYSPLRLPQFVLDTARAWLQTHRE